MRVGDGVIEHLDDGAEGRVGFGNGGSGLGGEFGRCDVVGAHAVGEGYGIVRDHSSQVMASVMRRAAPIACAQKVEWNARRGNG